MTQPTPPTPPVTPIDPPTDAVGPSPTPRRKRRWILKTLIVLVVGLVLLVLLLPTLLSLSPTRSFVLGKVQGYVPHGKLEAADWSLGWFSPIRLTGVKLLDERGQPVIEADEIKTNMTLLQAARQKFDLTGTVVDAAAHVVVFADGNTNLQHVLGLDEKKPETPHESKPAPTHPAKPTETTLPDVNGDITLKLRGDVKLLDTAEATIATVRLQPGSGGVITIPNINQPITTDLKFVYDTGESTRTGTVGLKSTVDAIEHNQIDLAGLSATLDLPVRDVDLAAFQPFIAVKYKGVRVAGVAGGDIAGELKAGQDGTIKGAIDVVNVEVAAPQLKDVYKAATLSLPVSVTRVVTAGVSRLRLDTGAVLPEASVKITGDVSEPTITKLTAQEMPVDAGTLGVTLTADLQKLAAALPNTVKLVPGTKVDQGSLVSGITFTLAPASVQAHVKTDVSLRGQQNGKPIAVEPITFTSDATLTQLQNPKDVRDLVVSLSSGFANFQAGGKTLATVQGKGDADLSRAQQQAAQFVDLGGLQLAGQAKFDLASTTMAENANARHATLNADVSGLKVVRPKQPTLEMATAEAAVVADLVTDADGLTVTAVKTATASLSAGQAADRPLVDASAVIGDFDVTNKKIGSVAVQKCDVPNLARLQTLIDPFVPALRAQKVQITDGSLAFVADLKDLDLNTNKVNLTRCEASLPKLVVSRDGKEVLRDTVRVSAAGTVTPDGAKKTIDLSKLSVDSAIVTLAKAEGPFVVQLHDGLPRGTGTLTVGVDVVRVNQIARLLSPPAADAKSSVPTVSAGRFDGTLALASAEGKDATVTFAGILSGLSLDGTPVRIETYTLATSVAVNAAFDHVTAVLEVKGDYFNVVGRNIAAKMPSATTPAFKALETATIDIGVRDLAKAQTVLSAFGVKLPVKAGGGLATKITAAGGTYTVDGGVSRLMLANDKGKTFAFDPKRPVTFKLTASAQGATAIESIKVDELSVDADVVKLRQAEPLSVRGLNATPTAEGKVQVTGSFDRLMPLLAVVQQADQPMPYRGTFDFTQTVVPQNGAISLKGTGTINDFSQLDAAGKPQFSEKQVQLKNDLLVNLTTSSATITALNLDMASSKAATVAISGGVDDWVTQRRLKNVVIHVDAVGEKVWPIVYAFMPPAQQTQFKDAKLTGPIKADFTVNGSYPVKPTWNESVRTVEAFGQVSMKSLNTMGLDVADFVLPLSVNDGGKLTTGDTRKKGAARFAKPFTVNNGQGDFGSIVLQLGDPELRLSIGRGQKILQKVELNAVLAAQLGSLASAVFEDAKTASGLIDLTVTECNNVRLLDLMNKQATASFLYGVKDLKLDGPVPSALAQALRWGTSGIVGDIDGATLTLKSGVANQNMLLQLQHENADYDENAKAVANQSKTKSESMKFEGGVNLANNTFKNYHLTLSPGLLIKDMRKKFPDGATVELKGKVTDMNGILAQALTQLAVEGYGKDALDKVLGGDKGDGKDDKLGDLLGKLGKKEKKAK